MGIRFLWESSAPGDLSRGYLPTGDPYYEQIKTVTRRRVTHD